MKGVLLFEKLHEVIDGPFDVADQVVVKSGGRTR